ncbi:MAG: hypothetical protein AAF677_16160, partial [Pseudomonadota bacterium]
MLGGCAGIGEGPEPPSARAPDSGVEGAAQADIQSIPLLDDTLRRRDASVGGLCLFAPPGFRVGAGMSDRAGAWKIGVAA